MEFELQRTIEILERTPGTLKKLLTGLSDLWITSNEGPETWSPVDILGHLIHGEDTDWIPRAKLILQQGTETTFEPFDRFAQFGRFKDKSIDELLELFKEKRKENIETLRAFNITENDLELPGTHPELGEVTLKQLLATWAVHDLSHIAQIARVMAKQYRHEVGVWRDYLPVLDK